MAIAGGATTAYKLSVRNGQLQVDKTTILAYLCSTPEGALERLRSWDDATSTPVTVQGSDMPTFWQLWGEAR